MEQFIATDGGLLDQALELQVERFYDQSLNK